ncbi:MAG: aromatic ring-hydroxylating dioxygenase subunit alpha [Methylovirgula sp.]
MLQSVLPPKVYLSEDILALENERIFKSLWIFAGLRSALANRNAFFTRKIGGVPVVVTTDGETIRAFENLCAHRSMPIQQEACGNRALICPYHAWTFNQDGSLRAMARPHLYDLRRAEKENIRLREFSVEIVGNLIFVNLAPEPAPFATQFTPEFMAEIKTASEHFDQVYAYTTFEVGYNWKLNFENVVDYNHVPFIHSASFGSMLPRQEVASPCRTS